jgi:hypothetical protein
MDISVIATIGFTSLAIVGILILLVRTGKKT